MNDMRSRFLWFMSVPLLLGLCVPTNAAAQASLPQSERRAGEIAPSVIHAPSHPMKLTRTVKRELSDGEAVIVSRSWRVTFVPQSLGYVVEGEQVDISVDAPASLKMLADIEQARQDQAMFSVVLDSNGMIVGNRKNAFTARNGSSVRPAVLAATDVARKMIKSAPMADTAKQMANDHVTHMMRHAKDNPAALPPDLFFPRSLMSEQERELTLAGEAKGTVRIAFSAERDEESMVMRRAKREISTHIGDSRRVSYEEWRLEPLTGE